jgi:hypothetical protein
MSKKSRPVTPEELAHIEHIKNEYGPDLAAIGLYHPAMDAMNILIVWKAVHDDPVLWKRSMGGNNTPLTENEKAALKRRVQAHFAKGGKPQ